MGCPIPLLFPVSMTDALLARHAVLGDVSAISG
jgi:hypothetical protein